MASMAGTSVGAGRMPSRRTWAIGGGLLLLVLGGYWYFNSRGDSGADRRGNAAPVRVAVVEQRDMAVVERSLGTVVANTAGPAQRPGAGHAGKRQLQGRPVRQERRSAVPDRSPALSGGAGPGRGDLSPRPGAAGQCRCATSNAMRPCASRARSPPSRAIPPTPMPMWSPPPSPPTRPRVDMARLNLDYTQIRSPVDGKTGPILVQPGNMISSPTAPPRPLVTIAAVQPIKVSFTLPQTDLPRIQARQQTKGAAGDAGRARPRADKSLAAPVDFTSNTVSNQSGTIELRATFRQYRSVAGAGPAGECHGAAGRHSERAGGAARCGQ